MASKERSAAGGVGAGIGSAWGPAGAAAGGWIGDKIGGSLFGDDEEDVNEPVPYRRLPGKNRPEDRAAKQQQYANLVAYYTRLGRPVPERIRRLAGDVSSSVDFSGDFNPSDVTGLRGIASQGQLDVRRPGPWNSRANQVLGENIYRQENEAWKNEYEPRFDSAINSAQDMVDTPTVGATAESEAKGRIAALISGDKEKALRATSATFGMRGLSPSNPAGAAVMARMSLEADAELARTLEGYGLDVSSINRQGQTRSIGLLTELTSRKLATENAIHDPEKLMQLNNEVSALLEALRTNKERMDFESSLARDGASRDWLSTGIQAAGVVAAPFTMGLSLAATAAARAAEQAKSRPAPSPQAYNPSASMFNY